MTLFTKIIQGEIPCQKIAESEDFFSFLDINPINEGHALVIPKIEVDRFFELPENYLSKIMVFAKPIVKAIESTVECKRVGSMIAGLEVPHAHLHLIPMINEGDLNFERAKPAVEEELVILAEKIRQALN